jgi:hypothetical protein
MKIHIELEMTPRSGWKETVAAVAAMAAVLAFGTVAYAQTEPSSESVIHSTLSSLASAVAALQTQVAALRAAEHVDRATLSASGDVVTENGAWVGHVDHPSPGTYVVRFASGAFTARPTCVSSALANDVIVPGTATGPVLWTPAVGCTPATLASVTCQVKAEPTRSGGVDTGISLICVGP